MNVSCPQCAATYLLPPSLLGPAGARVRCPQCSVRFKVATDGSVSADDGAPSAVIPRPASATIAPATASGATAIAREVIGALVERYGSELSEAIGRRELFARHGDDVLTAWDEYRRRAGDAAGAEPFRTELRERLGVDLLPRIER